MDAKAVTRAMYEQIWTEHRLELIDELIAEDVVLHVWGQEKVGREMMRTTGRDVWLGAFPDLAATVHLQVAEGDLVADHATFRGTHSGAAFHGIPPRGGPFSFTQTTICRVVDGQIADVWEDFDWAGLLRQLGA
ncbi:MAG: ester cyclase [Gaiellaceae bacterium]